MAKFAYFPAEWNGGNDETSHRSANFAPQNTAAMREIGAELAQMRRQYGMMSPRRHFRNCMARTGDASAVV